MKTLFILLMCVSSGLIAIGLYSGFSPTAQITRASFEPETTSSSVSTTIITSSTVIDATIESTSTTTSSSSSSSTIQPGDPECEELGCPEGTNFVGSVNSDMYHYCSCSHAKRINSENLVCFSTKEEAEEQGYIQSSCRPSTTTSSSTTSSIISSTTSISSTTTTQQSSSSTTTTSGSTTTTVISGTHIGEIYYLDPEWVKIISDVQVNMTGWTLSDAANHVYSFPSNFNLLGSVRVHTGYGNDNSTDLYWNRGQPVWNNDGDTATLKDNKGNIIDQKSY